MYFFWHERRKGRLTASHFHVAPVDMLMLPLKSDSTIHCNTHYAVLFKCTECPKKKLVAEIMKTGPAMNISSLQMASTTIWLYVHLVLLFIQTIHYLELLQMVLYVVIVAKVAFLRLSVPSNTERHRLWHSSVNRSSGQTMVYQQ